MPSSATSCSSRVAGYTPAWLDELAASGEIVWVGRGPLGTDDGKLALYLRDAAPLLIPPPADPDDTTATPLHQALLAHLAARGASFWPALHEAALRASRPTPSRLARRSGMSSPRSGTSSGRGW